MILIIFKNNLIQNKINLYLLIIWIITNVLQYIQYSLDNEF